MRPLADLLALILLLAASLLAGSSAVAGTTTAPDGTPVPFRATYTTALNGMPLGIDLHLELASAGAGNWNLALDASSLMMKYIESSQFRWEDCRAEPVKYRFEFRGFGVDRKLWLDFDHAKNVASGESRKGPVTFAFPPDVTDELGLSYAARCQLLRGASEVTYNVATTNGMKSLTYRIDGHEVLKTPYGKLDTIRIVRVRKAGEKRRSIIWVAPALGYVMVRMDHIEKLGVRGMATLKVLEGIQPAHGATP